LKSLDPTSSDWLRVRSSMAISSSALAPREGYREGGYRGAGG
jgi:hypothetical protein